MLLPSPPHWLSICCVRETIIPKAICENAEKSTIPLFTPAPSHIFFWLLIFSCCCTHTSHTRPYSPNINVLIHCFSSIVSSVWYSAVVSVGRPLAPARTPNYMKSFSSLNILKRFQWLYFFYYSFSLHHSNMILVAVNSVSHSMRFVALNWHTIKAHMLIQGRLRKYRPHTWAHWSALTERLRERERESGTIYRVCVVLNLTHVRVPGAGQAITFEAQINGNIILPGTPMKLSRFTIISFLFHPPSQF